MSPEKIQVIRIGTTMAIPRIPSFANKPYVYHKITKNKEGKVQALICPNLQNIYI